MAEDAFPGLLGAELARMGARLRALRRERGWRLEDLAERTKLSPAYLSRLECGERQPSLGALFICDLGLWGDFLLALRGRAESEERRGRAGDGESDEAGQRLFYTKLSEGSWTFNLQPLRVVVPAGREEGKLYQHEGEQWLYVLSGRLWLKLADEEFILEPGTRRTSTPRSPTGSQLWASTTPRSSS